MPTWETLTPPEAAKNTRSPFDKLAGQTDLPVSIAALTIVEVLIRLNVKLPWSDRYNQNSVGRLSFPTIADPNKPACGSKIS